MTTKTVTSEELWNTQLFSGLKQDQLDVVIQSARVITLAENEHLKNSGIRNYFPA